MKNSFGKLQPLILLRTMVRVDCHTDVVRVDHPAAEGLCLEKRPLSVDLWIPGY